jgi:3-methyl-2-oxobutanoate hydroxymethyltransferase
MGITPQTASKHGIDYATMLKGRTEVPAEMTEQLVAEARLLEECGAALIDFQNSGQAAGTAVTKAVKGPVVGGLGGGPWLDGRMRMAHAPSVMRRAPSIRRPRPTPTSRASRSMRSAPTPRRSRGAPDQGRHSGEACV